jgi:hypothetical protein
MKRQSSEDSWKVLSIVTDAAERFVNRSPRLKRLEAERQALLDAIRRAQLILSVKRLPVAQESASGDQNVHRERSRRERRKVRST